MTISRLMASAAIAGALTLPTTGAEAQQQGGGMPFTARMARTFGPTGLIAEFGQNENYGAVQTRQAQSRAQIAAANADQVFDGYADSVNKFNLPVTGTFNLPGNNAGVRVKGTYLGSWADENITYADSQGITGLVEYLFMPGANTLLGFGVLAGTTDVTIKHNDGSIDADNIALQFDLLHNLSDHWGLAGRAIYRWNDTKTKIPLGFADLVTDQGSETFYTEWTLVGNYENDTLAFLPDGWLLRPRLQAVYTSTSFDTVTNSLGGINDGTVGPSDEYATLAARLRMLQPVFRPGQHGFYGEIGYEREVINDLNLVLDDPNIFRGKVGFQTMLDNGVFMDIGLSMETGGEGLRKQNALTWIITKSF